MIKPGMYELLYQLSVATRIICTVYIEHCVLGLDGQMTSKEDVNNNNYGVIFFFGYASSTSSRSRSSF